MHTNWKHRIRAFLDGENSLTSEQASSHFDCDLGKWLYSTGKKNYGHLSLMITFEKEHENLHEIVKQILFLKINNQQSLAEAKYAELLESSDNIIKMLAKIEKLLVETNNI